jgi:hypothetical protein
MRKLLEDSNWKFMNSHFQKISFHSHSRIHLSPSLKQYYLTGIGYIPY